MKSILTIALTFVCLAYTNAQPISVEVECTTLSSVFTQINDATFNDCPCYESEDSDRVLYLRENSSFDPMFPMPSTYIWVSSLTTDGTCATITPGLGATRLSLGTKIKNCNILEAQIDQFCTITEAQPISPIPTMGQWALLILGLCMTTVGVIKIRNSSVAGA